MEQLEGITRKPIWRALTNGGLAAGDDLLAVEEPLEIRLGYDCNGERRRQSVSVTMRTPGHDFELAAGFLFTEAIVNSAGEIAAIESCGGGNVVRVDLTPEVKVDLKRLERHFYTTSSCGVCGKTSLEAVRAPTATVRRENGFRVPTQLISQLPEFLLSQQSVFRATGGLHASALFSADGELLLVREDVGRHNALDKLIGRALMDNRLPLADALLLVSGRASFELVQKAVRAGIPALAAVGAPSSLAVELASENGLALFGFVRPGRFNVYCGEGVLK